MANLNEINELSDFTGTGWKAYFGKSTDGDPDRYVLMEKLIAYLQIYTPTTQPAIVAGTPDTLTLDCNSREQCLFESRASVGTRTISVDFTYAFSNTTNTKLIHDTLSLTGTIIITMPASVLVSNTPSIASWMAPDLTISAGTNDIIEFSFLYDTTASKWKLTVSNPNV